VKGEGKKGRREGAWLGKEGRLGWGKEKKKKRKRLSCA